eukprot:2324636-Rhodomonas_salina.2
MITPHRSSFVSNWNTPPTQSKNIMETESQAPGLPPLPLSVLSWIVAMLTLIVWQTCILAREAHNLRQVLPTVQGFRCAISGADMDPAARKDGDTIYLHHFQLALETVLKHRADYKDLFTVKSHAFAEQSVLATRFLAFDFAVLGSGVFAVHHVSVT